MNSDIQNFSWQNSFWCAYITMTTVGYGDFYPATRLGRVTGIIASLIGSILQALAVIALFEILEFSKTEAISYKLSLRVRK